ncbi:glycosyltransferase family protein [Microbacterium sp. 18062]|uniref:glycosyltransferase family protein n=1 Tax=Microbacterium sp. 18062 TaxID=2681410 RepID=UPI0013578B62|nr:glycosyltransferase [Microbacterium sp. 18062]
MVIRIALYSHDSVGLGHVRRNLGIAHALTRVLPDLTGEEVTGLIVSGQSAAAGFAIPAGWDWLILPGIMPGEDGYRSRRLNSGIDRVTAVRGGSVHAAMAAFGPDLFIVDRHPFGVDRELESTLRWLRASSPRTRTVLGLRDVLDRPRTARAEWKAIGGAASVRAHFDAIWAYGDPEVHDLSVSGELPPGLRPLVQHTGYLSHGRPGRGHAVTEEPFVLTTVGGGSDGFEVASAAARAALPPGRVHVVVAGPEMSDEHRRALRDSAGERTTIVRSVPDALALFRRAEAVVSMGGYNTVTELMSTRTPALIVPRRHRRKEQRIRAEMLAARGAVERMDPDEATPEALGDWFSRNAGATVDREGIDLWGLDAVGRLAADLVREARAQPEAVPYAI